MTISDLANRSGLSDTYVKSKIKTISGVRIEDGEIYIPEGSRFPYDVSRFRKFTFENCRYIILKATDHNRYVDADMLHLTQAEFNGLIEELVEVQFLRKVESENTYGANEYITTWKFDVIKQERRESVIKSITKAVATLGEVAVAATAAAI